jgi:hypothetical protein
VEILFEAEAVAAAAVLPWLLFDIFEQVAAAKLISSILSLSCANCAFRLGLVILPCALVERVDDAGAGAGTGTGTDADTDTKALREGPVLASVDSATLNSATLSVSVTATAAFSVVIATVVEAVAEAVIGNEEYPPDPNADADADADAELALSVP